MDKSENAPGDELGPLLQSCRDRLRHMVDLRLHPGLQGRVDASDVVQEAFLEASRRYPQYRDRPRLPFYLWVRRIAGDKLCELHRNHLGAQKRDARREARNAPEVNTVSLSRMLLFAGVTPSQAQTRNEELERLRAALEQLEENEREALTLRHYEEATNQEVARILGVSEAKASRCYTRALRALRSVLEKP
jgi:RNA polymerase sigma-70 factor (ECF subfamily)